MKKILLHGAFFSSNYGDVLFSDIFKATLEQKSTVLLGNIGQYVKERNGIKKHKSEFFSLLESDAVVFAPGGYFGEPDEKGLSLFRWRLRMIRKHAYLGVLAKLLRKPYCIIGIGVGPIHFKIGKRIVKSIFDGAKLVTVRDDESYNYLKEMNVKNPRISVSVDSILCKGEEFSSAVSCLEAIADIKDNDGRILLLHITSGGENGLEVCRAVREFISNRENFKLIICTDFEMKRENKYIESVKGVFANMEYTFLDYSPELLTSAINSADLVVTSKLHVGVVAASFSRSVLSFPVHSKTVRFYKQIGAPDRCIPMKEITKEQVLMMLDRYERVPVSVTKDLINRSKLNYSILDEFVKELGKNSLF